MKSPSGEVPSELFVRDRSVSLCISSLLRVLLVRVRKDSRAFTNGSRLESTARRFKEGDAIIVVSVLKVLESEVNIARIVSIGSYIAFPTPFSGSTLFSLQ